MSDPHEQIREFLQAHGVAPTSQRLEVAQILFARPQHLSADQILAAVKKVKKVYSGTSAQTSAPETLTSAAISMPVSQLRKREAKSGQ